MSDSINSLLKSGTKLWLDSVDPELVSKNLGLGATGATSNPIIISDLIKSGRFDEVLARFLSDESSVEKAAWALTDYVVSQAQTQFASVWESTGGNDGYVSFEVDPLLEDPSAKIPLSERTAAYVALGTKWSSGKKNRMIKVPATEAGIAALPELAAKGVPLNVTLVFTMRQYEAARDAIWQGAQRLSSLNHFKSVYSIFVSRVDVYTQKNVAELSPSAQGLVGILNAQEIWSANQEFWKAHPTPLQQEIVFASTGTKNPEDAPWKYVAALAGSDIQTNPPATNDAIAAAEIQFQRTVDKLPPSNTVSEIHEKVDTAKLEEVLMREGIEKFASPQKALLELIQKKAEVLA